MSEGTSSLKCLINNDKIKGIYYFLKNVWLTLIVSGTIISRLNEK